MSRKKIIHNKKIEHKLNNILKKRIEKQEKVKNMTDLPLSVTQLLQSGCPWSDRLCAKVAALGDLDALIFLREKTDCPWNLDYVVYKSIKYGRLPCLEYAHKKGCTWSDLTTSVFPKTSCEDDFLACNFCIKLIVR